jgi:acetoin utilization deacetylase AcuC-like enzyme
VTFFDADTQSNQHSYHAARLAAGAVVGAVDHVTEEPRVRPFAVVRPPGHHAEADRAMGFCFINSVAVGAAYALAELSYSRVAIVDWDVHHGNGTQHIFYDRGDVFYVSLHQSPHYPGTGAASERGRGAGEDATLNVPMAAGSDGADYLRAFEEQILPELDRYRPELVMVSAGFDAHRNDPLASMQLGGTDYAAMTQRLLSVANRHAAGRIVHVLEGGYDLDALCEGADAVIRCLLEP